MNSSASCVDSSRLKLEVLRDVEREPDEILHRVVSRQRLLNPLLRQTWPSAAVSSKPVLHGVHPNRRSYCRRVPLSQASMMYKCVRSLNMFLAGSPFLRMISSPAITFSSISSIYPATTLSCTVVITVHVPVQLSRGHPYVGVDQEPISRVDQSPGKQLTILVPPAPPHIASVLDVLDLPRGRMTVRRDSCGA